MYDEQYYFGRPYEEYTFQALRPIFLNRIYLLRKFAGSSKGKLLDVGCALGLFLKYAEREGFDVYGVDISDYAIKYARRNVSKKCVRADVEKCIPFKTSFNIVTAWDVIEHLKQPALFLKRVNRLLKKDGLFFIETLNYNSLAHEILKEKWSPLDPVHHHLTPTITPAILKNWLEKSGFEVIKIYTCSISLLGILKYRLKFVNQIVLNVHQRETKKNRASKRHLTNSVIRSLLEWINRFLSKLLQPLNLNELIICVARKKSSCSN